MPNRKADVDALINRSEKDFAAVRAAYDKALHDHTISAELRIDIKNLCGNLRSALDYLAADMRDKHCAAANPSARFYFPILPDANQYQNQMNNWFPGLRAACVDLWNYLESVQPYHASSAWLGKFNRVNNENKHESLVEQTRTETQRVNVWFAGGSVNWDPSAVRFGPGVFIGGVPVNPSTQMPVPHPSQKVEKIIWVDFKFDGIDESAIALLQNSLEGVKKIVDNVYKWL
jgi:hypothetical protein